MDHSRIQALEKALDGVTLDQGEADIIKNFVQSAVRPGFQNAEEAIRASVGEVPMDNAQMAIDAGQLPGKPYLTGQANQRKYTRAEKHSVAAAAEMRSGQRNLAASEFLAANPQFETFLDLIKDGAITLY